MSTERQERGPELLSTFIPRLDNDQMRCFCFPSAEPPLASLLNPRSIFAGLLTLKSSLTFNPRPNALLLSHT
jgi:hypothetical protein